MRRGVLLLDGQFRIFAVFKQVRLLEQTTIQSPARGDNQFLQPTADGENGDAPFERGGNQRHAQKITPGIGVRLIAVFTIKVRLHVAWAARQVNPVQGWQQSGKQLRLRQRMRQGNR
jgi:hypothetical protein